MNDRRISATTVSALDRRYVKRMETYWASQFRMAIREIDRLNLDGWFDLWHTHVDWRSKGNRHLEQRRRAASLTYDAFLHVLDRISTRTAPIQAWAQFFADTGSNSVYLHSPNDNGTVFPYVFEDTTWGATAPPELAHIRWPDEFELGEIRFRDETSYVLRRRQ